MATVIVVPQARLHEADLHYSEALVDRELALGTAHPLTVLALGNFAQQNAAQEDKVAEAEAMFREEIAAHTQNVGADHPNTLQAKISLARALALLGQPDEARTLARAAAAAADRDVARGTGLPDASAPLQLAAASVLELTGDAKEAEGLVRAALQRLRQRPASPAEASRAALGACLALERVAPKAPDVPKLVADARSAWAERALAEPPAALALGPNLAARLLQPRWAGGPPAGAGAAAAAEPVRYQSADWVLADPRVLAQAEPLLQLAFDRRAARLGRGHAHALAAAGNLAVCRLALGRAAEAEALFREQQAGLEALGLEPSDPALLECGANVARALEAAGRLEEARDAFSAAAEEAAGQEGAAASGLLAARMLDLARCEAALGNGAEAEVVLREAFDNCEGEVGCAHPATRACAYALAQHLQDLGKLDEAEQLLEDFRQRSGEASRAEALEAEPPVALAVVTSVAGLLRATRL